MGLDVSSYQNARGPIDYAKVRQAGRTFVLVRATMGHADVDASMPANVRAARAAGLQVGVYHFAYPQLNTADVEAAHFLATIRGHLRPGDLLPMLDYEEVPNRAWAERWLTLVRRGIGGTRWPLWYTNTSMAHDLAGSRLLGRCGFVQADFGPNDGRLHSAGAAPYQPVMHQYTSRGTLPGISGPVDLDEQLRRRLTYKPVRGYVLRVVAGGRTVARVRYGGGRVRAFLAGSRLLELLRHKGGSGLELLRVHRHRG